MRRSSRNALSTGLPVQYQECLNQTDSYTRALNLKPLIIPLPLPQKRDKEGLRQRLLRNNSFCVSTFNQKPDPFPFELQYQDTSNAEERITMFIESLSEPKPGLLVMFLQPPEGTDFRFTDDVDEARPLCGVIVRIGASTKEEAINETSNDKPYELPFERSIVGAFCRRSVPNNVAEELLTVTLIRAIVEAMCYEDINKNELYPLLTGMIDENVSGATVSPIHPTMTSVHRDKRFISINASDLPLCPTVFLTVIRNKIKFVSHVDREVVTSIIEHTDDAKIECKCWKIYRRRTRQQQSMSARLSEKKTQEETQTSSRKTPSIRLNTPKAVLVFPKASPNSRSAFSGVSLEGYYQFWILSASRIKNYITKAVPCRASDEVINFCLGSADRYAPKNNFPSLSHDKKGLKHWKCFAAVSGGQVGSDGNDDQVRSRKRRGSTVPDDEIVTPRKKEQKTC